MSKGHGMTTNQPNQLDRAAFNPVVGVPPTLEWVPVALIGVDPAYQRSTDNELSQTLIRKIARFWDWNLCQPLSLTRRADGSLWAVDGQHRHAAAQMRGDIPHLPCVIARYANQSDEASAFVALNRQRKPMTAVDLFKAALAAGDGQAHQVMEAITAAGLTIAPHSNYTNWTPGMIFCVPGVQRAWQRRGPQVTRNALATLSEAFDGQVLRYAGLLLDGLYDLFTSRFAESAAFDRAALVATLASRPQDQWITAGRSAQVETGLSRSLSIAKAMISAMPAPRPVVSPVPPPASARAASMPPPAPVPTISRPVAIVEPEPVTGDSRRWCDQCERRVSLSAATLCKSRFCRLRPKLVATR
jgi:hypothetical protein